MTAIETPPAVAVTDEVLAAALDLVRALASTASPNPGRAIATVPARPALAEHLEHLRWRNLSPGTIAQRRYLMRRLARWRGTDDPLTATTADLIGFLDRPAMDGRPLAPASRANELMHLRAFYGWAVDAELLDRSPARQVPSIAVPESVVKPITEADLARALATAPDRIRLAFFLAGYAGLRAKEIAPLRGQDVDLSAGRLLVRSGKGARERIVPVAPVLGEVLAELPRRGWYFPYRNGQHGHIPPHLVSRLANEHLHRLGVWETLHSLRHRFGTAVYRASGRDIRATQELLGHRSLASTQIYTHVDLDEAATTVAALP